MGEFLKIFSMIIFTAAAISAFFLGGGLLIEGKNLINPYVDTVFAENYSPEKFDLIKVGMTKKEVKEIIGEPIEFTSKANEYGNEETFQYTKDGKQMNSGKNYLFIGDSAWYLSFVHFKNDIVVEINKNWAFD